MCSYTYALLGEAQYFSGHTYASHPRLPHIYTIVLYNPHPCNKQLHNSLEYCNWT